MWQSGTETIKILCQTAIYSNMHWSLKLGVYITNLYSKVKYILIVLSCYIHAHAISKSNIYTVPSDVHMETGTVA